MAAGGREAVRVDDEVIGATVEILKQALTAARAKRPLLRWPSPDPDGSR
jgi:hypothetical protein